MPREPNTREPVAVAPEAVAEAGALVDQADRLLADAMRPEEEEAGISVEVLERVLALYGAAIRLDPEEPAYPWNLGSALSRLGLNELAMGFLARAIRLSSERKEQDWSGSAARLALAEVAMDAASYDLALISLAQARASDDGHLHADEIAELFQELSREIDDPRPQAWLVQLLNQLPGEGRRSGKGSDSDRHVVPNNERGGWDVVKEDHKRSSGHFDRKTEAVNRAREIVRNEGGGEIRIHNKEGMLIDSDSVGGPKRGGSPPRDLK